MRTKILSHRTKNFRRLADNKAAFGKIRQKLNMMEPLDIFNMAYLNGCSVNKAVLMALNQFNRPITITKGGKKNNGRKKQRT